MNSPRPDILGNSLIHRSPPSHLPGSNRSERAVGFLILAGLYQATMRKTRECIPSCTRFPVVSNVTRQAFSMVLAGKTARYQARPEQPFSPEDSALLSKRINPRFPLLAAAASQAPVTAVASASGLDQAIPASTHISTTANASSPPSSSTSPIQAALLTTLTVILLGVALWRARRLQRPDNRASDPPSLLPRLRHGATPHELLRDSKYLSQILEAEAIEGKASDQRQRQPPQAGLPAPPISSNVQDTNAESAPDRSPESDRAPAN